MEKMPITKDGFERLKKELEILKTNIFLKIYAISKLRALMVIFPKMPNILRLKKGNLFCTENFRSWRITLPSPM